MPEFGFCGPAYQSQSVNANAQKCENFYLERDESGTGKSKFQLLCTPGTKAFARLYDDVTGLSVSKSSFQGTAQVLTLPDGNYYAALVLIDGNGNAFQRSRVFGPFPLSTKTFPHSPPFVRTMAAKVPSAPPPGSTWYVYFGTNRTNLNQRLPVALSLTVLTPGSAAVLPDVNLPNSVPAQIEKDGRTFATSETGFWEIYSDNYARFVSSIANDFLPKVLAASNIQVVLSSAGKLYVYTLATDIFQEILTDGTTALQGPVVSVGFSDSYIVALLRDGTFQISGILDAINWDPNDRSKVSVFADTPIGMKVDHREIIIYSAKHYVVYYDSGNPLFPFDVVPGGFAEMGAAAPASVERADNTLFWIGSDERGTGMAWRAQGYSPARISTHAIEEHWRKFSTVNDARTFAYQEAGHTHIVFYFPSADETWVYDVATQSWHQRSGLAVESHSFSFGKHLVGSAKTGTLYEMSVDLLTYDGAPIKRDRTAPHISQENARLAHNEFRLDMEVGLGPQPPLLDGEGKPRGPKVMLQWSDDGGHTWSNIHARDVGAAGEYRKRVRWLRLGSSRDRVYKVTFSEQVPCRLINAYLNPEP